MVMMMVVMKDEKTIFDDILTLEVIITRGCESRCGFEGGLERSRRCVQVKWDNTIYGVDDNKLFNLKRSVVFVAEKLGL